MLLNLIFENVLLEILYVLRGTVGSDIFLRGPLKDSLDFGETETRDTSGKGESFELLFFWVFLDSSFGQASCFGEFFTLDPSFLLDAALMS